MWSHEGEGELFFHSFFLFLALYIWKYFCVQCLLFVQIVDGESSLSDPLLVRALFLISSALECQLPVEDVQSAGAHHPPVTRWQIKVPVKRFILWEAWMFPHFQFSLLLLNINHFRLLTVTWKNEKSVFDMLLASDVWVCGEYGIRTLLLCSNNTLSLETLLWNTNADKIGKTYSLRIVKCLLQPWTTHAVWFIIYISLYSKEVFQLTFLLSSITCVMVDFPAIPFWGSSMFKQVQLGMSAAAEYQI